mmetsp:Transcript_9023/g.16783  ORF Transcript_9023/g.16783 Transcript_9023/m.16783 type:complete len:81 (+) Transcript_9023:3004-3246(+)
MRTLDFTMSYEPVLQYIIYKQSRTNAVSINSRVLMGDACGKYRLQITSKALKWRWDSFNSQKYESVHKHETCGQERNEEV